MSESTIIRCDRCGAEIVSGLPARAMPESIQWIRLKFVVCSFVAGTIQQSAGAAHPWDLCATCLPVIQGHLRGNR